MPKRVEEIQEELIKWFGERITDSMYYADYGKIGSFLSDPAQYKPALRQLHDEMERLFDSRGPGFSGGEQMRRPLYRALAELYENTEPGGTKGMLQYRFSKLLTTVLWENEIKNGFNAGARSSEVDILIGLSGKKFNWLLRNYRPFKDIGASKEHGENSHRIQWYLISKISGLENPVTVIYRGLTGWGTQEVYEPEKRKIYMWEFLVDRDGVPSNVSLPIKTESAEDFRAPSNVNRHLISGALDEFYLLKACLVRRWRKRSVPGGAWAYYLRKRGLDEKKLPIERMAEVLMGELAVVERH